MRWITMPAVVALAAAMAMPVAQAQHQGMSEATPQGPYAPRLGDIMILQQIRHSKLWFAAANNWELADHELDELEEAFEDVAKLFPTVSEVSVAPVISALKEREIAELDQAITARDRAKFAAGLRQADRRLQRLPSGHQARLHRHPAADLAALQQPVVQAGSARPGSARPRALRDQSNDHGV